jgi:hypothetical protein
VISPLAQEKLRIQLADIADAAWIEQGTGRDSANFSRFVLVGDRVMFYFDPYQVGPYALGPQTVTIALADLAVVMALLGS